jgi:hypothetical protein
MIFKVEAKDGWGYFECKNLLFTAEVSDSLEKSGEYPRFDYSFGNFRYFKAVLTAQDNSTLTVFFCKSAYLIGDNGKTIERVA